MFTENNHLVNVMEECNRIEALLTEANNIANGSANTITTIAACRVNIKSVQVAIEGLIYQLELNSIANT